MTRETPPPMPVDDTPLTRTPNLLTTVVVAAIALLVYLSAAMFIKPFKSPAWSMSPTIRPHDRFYIEKLTYMFHDPQRGDIIVFRTDGIPTPGVIKSTYYFKRVAGIPGDRIGIVPPNLIVNGQPLKEPAIFATISSCRGGYGGFSPADPVTPGALLTSPTNEVFLGEGEFYVLGDNTRNSWDSRYWGPVPRKNIVGRVIAIYWPLNRLQTVTSNGPTLPSILPGESMTN